MTTQYFKVRNGLSVGEDAVTVDAATGNVVATGDITVKDTVTIQGATSGSVALAAPATAGSQAYTLPTALPGVSGYVLASDTGGVMSWVANPDTNTTYTIDASSTTGGANLNLVGSDASTDTIKIASGTGVTVAQVSANELSVAIGQAVGTGDSPSFAGVTGGNISVGVATDNTIASTDTNGNIVLDPNGTGVVAVNAITRAQMEVQASTSLTYTFPPQTLNTVSDNNGFSAASSIAGSAGYGANAGFAHYFADTLAGNNTTGAFNFRTANGNSETGITLPWTGVASVAPSATLSTNTLGTLNFNGYATNGFSSEVATQYQGGGINSLHSMQIQATAAENFSDSTLTVGSANITAVASSFRTALTTPAVTGTKGQISFGATTPGVGNAIRVTGTLTGTATGIVSGQTYYIIVTGSTTTAQLSATPGGLPITTTAGTLTGLTLTRCGVTFTLSGQTSVPFGRGALVAVTGVNNVTDGTYPVVGTPTTTSVALGIPHTVAPTLSGTQSFSCTTVYAAGGYRIRSFPLATPMNLQNRVELVNHTAASFAVRADAVSFNAGGYGTSGVGITGDKISYNRVTGSWYNTGTITPAGANTAYAFAPGTSDTGITNIASVGSTSRIIPGAAGKYNLQFSVQWNNGVNSEYSFYIWLRKNGTDVAESAGKVTCAKSASGIASWNYLLSSANTTDYWELMYSVESTDITFPYVAASSPVPGIPSIITTLVPVGA
jgi:hypothetical protein